MNNLIRALLLCLVITLVPSLSHAAKTHKVKRSETLNSLARKYHVTVDDLKTANNLVSAQVKKGDIIIIPPSTENSAPTDSSDQLSAVYKVKRTELLSKISKKTGISVAEIKRLNNIQGTRAKAGLILALRESDHKAEDSEKAEKTKPSKRYSLRYAELFNEKDYEHSLAELTDTVPGNSLEPMQKSDRPPDSVKQLKSAAYGFLGTRYRFGGNTKSGLDCSAFVQKVFRELDILLPRSAREQFEIGNQVPHGDLKRGDLVFFSTYARYASHVGIYLGDNRMIHASSRDRRVVISSLNSQYYRARYLGAKRISKVNPDLFNFNDLLVGIEEESPDDAIKNDTMGTMGISLNN